MLTAGTLCGRAGRQQQNQADATREELALAAERLGLGAIANSDYLQVKTQLASEEATLATAVNNLKMAKLNLMQLMEYPLTRHLK